MNSDDIYEPPKKRKKWDGNKKAKINGKVALTRKPRVRVPNVNFLSLNDNCILAICEYLSVRDLFSLSEISSSLRMVISTRIIDNKLIDFDELSWISCEKVFAMFGKYMAKIKIGEKHVESTKLNRTKFDEILHQISTHCSNGLLKHVEFQFCNSTTIISEATVKDVLPFLRNIESFEMSEPLSETTLSHRPSNPLSYHFVFEQRYLVNDSVNNFINLVLKNSTNIKSAKFQNFRITGEWLLFYHMQSVEILSFVNCTVEKNGCLIAFMQRKPALRSFTWRLSSVDRVANSANFVLNLVGNNVPLLNALSFEKNHGCFESDLYIPEQHSDFLNENFLVNLNNLKEFACSFVFYGSSALNIRSLRILGRQNSIEKLSIFGCYGSSMGLDYLKHFTSLRCVEINNHDDSNGFHRSLILNLPNLKECCLIQKRKVTSKTVKYIVETAKKLEILKLKAPAMEFTANLYSNLLKIRMKSLNCEPLRIYIDETLNTFIEQLGRKYQPNIVKLIPFNYKSL